MERLTAKKKAGMNPGYWSPMKEPDILQRLGKYEDTGLTPDQIMELKGVLGALRDYAEHLGKEKDR